MIELEGPTRMDGIHFKAGGSIGGIEDTNLFCGTHQPCPHSGWTWEGHVGSKNTNAFEQIEKPNIPASFVTKKQVV